MKWLHGYSTLIFSTGSVVPSFTARYSLEHIHEESFVIASFLNKLLFYLFYDNTASIPLALKAAPWYQYEDNLIILFQAVAIVFALISIVFIIFSVICRDKSILYATAVLLTAYSLYFINTILAVVIIFITIVIILNLRKVFGHHI